jgi:hypothetical protein
MDSHALWELAKIVFCIVLLIWVLGKRKNYE